MVELQEAEVTEHVETPEVPQTAGSLLRHAREAAGMHVSTLAEMLKVPVVKLHALETNDWQKLPDAIFVRSLALSICKALQVDATPVMELLPKASSAKKFTAPSAGINEPVVEKALRSVHDNPGQGGAWKLLALALLAGVGGGAWYFMQKQEVRDAVVASVQERKPASSTVEQAPQPVAFAHPAAEGEPVPAVEPVAPVDHTAHVAAAVPGGVAGVVAQAPQAVTVHEAAPVAAAVPAVPATPVVAAVAPAAAVLAPVPAAPVAEQPAVAAGNTTLRIHARATTWIQVRGAGGKVLDQKTLNVGEIFETQAPRPLSVVIGRADAAEVQVGGAAFDLASVARENVARFEVK